MTLKKNDKVYWLWMGKKIQGHVVDIFTQPIAKEIKGKRIKRNGSVDNPAYYVQSEAGNFALKLSTEVFKADKDVESKNKKITPKMFG